MLARSKSVLFACILGIMLVIVVWSALAKTVALDGVVAETATGLRFVTDAGTPLADAKVRLLCYVTTSAGAPLADLMVTTNANGEPVESLPADCNYAAALHLLHEQPSGKPDHGPAYWIYATSWPPGSNVPLTATDVITISENRSIVLFNVVASLAWEPAPNSPYVAELQQGLHDASRYLQDLTEGQMAFGPVRIHTNGRHWDSADLRFLPANDFRPTAYVGGIISQTTLYSNPGGMLGDALYAPAASYFGRYWDGTDAFDPIDGSWGKVTGSRTIAHEWGHYALFLYDEYQSPLGQSIYCTCDTLPDGTCTPGELQASAMSYHYTASEFWHETVHGQPDACLKSSQWLVHGQTDWQTLAAWGNIQNLPAGLTPIHMPSNLTSGFSQLVDDLFGRAPAHHIYLPGIKRDGSTPAPAGELSLSLAFTGSALLSETLPTQLYVLEQAVPGPAQRILHQGTAVGPPDSSGFLGHIVLLGIDPDADSAWTHVDRYTTRAVSGGRFIYPDPHSTLPVFSGGYTGLAATDPWQASLDVTYALSASQLTTMTLVLSATNVPDGSYAQLCLPDAAIGCHPGWHRSLEEAPGDLIWTATFTPLQGMDELPPYGLVQVHAPDTGELIRWVQVSGVGPAHGDGEGAPLRDGLVMVDTTGPISKPMVDRTAPILKPSACNRVIIMPAADYEALISQLQDQSPEAEEILGLVGPPLDIDILLPDGTGACSNLDTGHPVSVILTLFYSQETIDRLDIDENTDLRILHYTRNPDQGLGFWDVVLAAGISSELNWIATEVNEDGIYAIGWVKQP